MSTSISTVVYRDPVREFQRAAGGPVVRLLAANGNDALAESAALLSLDRAPGDAYRWSDPRRARGLSWQAWSATLALHGLAAVMIAAVAWTSRPVPPSLPTVTVVFEAPAAPLAQPAVQPETPPPAPASQPRAETPPVAPSAAPAPVAAKAPAEPMQVAVLPLPPPPRPALRETAAPPRLQPVSRTVPAPTPVSTPAARAPAPSTAVAAVPVIPPRPASGVADNRKPVYPLAARNQRWQGRVVLQVDVAASGDPLAVRVVTSSGHALLDDSALAAVRTWRFMPASQGGRPVPGTVDVPVDFRMVD